MNSYNYLAYQNNELIVYNGMHVIFLELKPSGKIKRIKFEVDHTLDSRSYLITNEYGFVYCSEDAEDQKLYAITFITKENGNYLVKRVDVSEFHDSIPLIIQISKDKKWALASSYYGK